MTNFEGTLATSPDQLLSVVKDFYSDLYQSSEMSPLAVNQLLSTAEPALTDEDRAICEGPLQEEECLAAVR